MPNYNTGASSAGLFSGSGLNYVGSSGYGVLPGGRYGRLTASPNRAPVNRPEYAIWDASRGIAVNVRTGEVFNGKDPMTGRTFQNGLEIAQSSTTPTGADRYQTLEVVRSPSTLQDTNQMIETFRRNADSSLEDFSAITSQFRDDLSAARDQARSSTDITPTVNALNTAQRDYSGELGLADERYRQANEQAAAEQRALVQRSEDLLPSYDTALDNTLANQLALVRGNVSRYKMGTSTPRSMGSAENQLLIRGATEASLPIEMARIGRRYDNLTGIALPVSNAIAARDIAYAGGFMPSVAGSRYGSASTTATTIQALTERAASSGFTNAALYLQQYGMPERLQQEIFNGQISEREALRQLEEASLWRGLEDRAGMQVEQPVSYNMTLPGIPNYPTRYPTYPGTAATTGTGGSSPNYGFTGLGPDGVGVRYRGLAANAPQIVSPTSPAPPNTRYTTTAQGWPIAINTTDHLPNYYRI